MTTAKRMGGMSRENNKRSERKKELVGGGGWMKNGERKGWTTKFNIRGSDLGDPCGPPIAPPLEGQLVVCTIPYFA